MAEKEPEKWLKIEISAPAELLDALGNFLTETGAQGVFQETLEPQSPGDFLESPSSETINAYFPQDTRAGKRLAAVQKYLESLSEIFSDLTKPCLLYTSDAADEEDSVDLGGRR